MNLLKLRDSISKAWAPDHLNLQTTFDVFCGSIWSTPMTFDISAVLITIQFEMHAESK
jgi:hypothetical protein